MALALETMGFTRYDNEDLLPDNDNKIKFKKKRKYMIISGDEFLSPKKKISKHISHVVKEDNIDGKNIEVILISRTGSEGIDLKYIRNIFIIDPWYNINRLEQIIGRGIRENSHKLLPFEKPIISAIAGIPSSVKTLQSVPIVAGKPLHSIVFPSYLVTLPENIFFSFPFHLSNILNCIVNKSIHFYLHR